MNAVCVRVCVCVLWLSDTNPAVAELLGGEDDGSTLLPRNPTKRQNRERAPRTVRDIKCRLPAVIGGCMRRRRCVATIIPLENKLAY